MKTSKVFIGLIIVIFAFFIILSLRNDPTVDEAFAKLTEPPKSDYDLEYFNFDAGNGVENSNKPTCVIIYDYTTNSYVFDTIVQSNLVHSASEIIQILSKYGWQADTNNSYGSMYSVKRPTGQTNGFFFVGDPRANKVLIP